MWLLMVTAIASAVLADAGYIYKAPNGRSNIPYRRPPTVHPVHRSRAPHVRSIQGFQEQDNSIIYSVSYKDYVYLKNDNYNAHPYQSNQNYNNVQVHGNLGHVESNGGFSASQNTQNNVGHSSNGYGGYTQPFTSAINYNNNYAQSYTPPATNAQNHHHHVASPVTNFGTNRGHLQAHQYTTGSGYSNSYNQPSSVGIAHNTGYTQTITAPDVNNYNSYSQTSGSAATAAKLNNIYVHNTIPAGSSNLNTGYVSTATATSNQGYAQALPQASTYGNSQSNQFAPAASNHVYSQAAQVQVPVDTGYSQNGYNTALSNNGYNEGTYSNTASNNGYHEAVQVNAPLSYGQSQYTLSPSTTNVNPHNGYTNIGSSESTNYNTGFGHGVTNPISSNLNNGYEQTFTSSSASASSNTAYEAASISSSTNLNSPSAPSLLSTASGISNTGSSDISGGPIHFDLNPRTIQQSAPSSLHNGVTQTLTAGSDNLNSDLVNGLVQNNVNVATNPSPVNPPVTPIIHKHIYFHVPPPEIEEPERPTPPPPPPKKNYKILFIKVPSQDSQSNLVRLQQQLAEKMKSNVEEKTLIYVLVKNPEDPKPVVLPERKPSEHQVYFVKYGGNPFDIASQVNDEIDNTGAVKSIVPLEPGLVNGENSPLEAGLVNGQQSFLEPGLVNGQHFLLEQGLVNGQHK